MDSQDRNAVRERVATACLAAMLGTMNEWGAGHDGATLAKVACDYADSLLAELQLRQDFNAA